MTTRIEVDFNSRNDAGWIPAFLEDADGHLHVGDTVQAFDDEGYRCLAVVEAVAGQQIGLGPRWQTFANPEQPLALVERLSPRLNADWTNRLTLYVEMLAPAWPNTEPASGTQPSVAEAPQAARA